MRLVSFGEKGQERVGVAVDGDILDLVTADVTLPDSVVGILEQDAFDAVARAVESGRGTRITEDGVRLGAPITRPSKIVCVGLNYHDHAAEQNVSLPEHPLLFSKASSSVIGPYDEVVLPEECKQVDGSNVMFWRAYTENSMNAGKKQTHFTSGQVHVLQHAPIAN